MGMISEFREFALKGNALDLAVGVVIGAAFGGIVNSLVNDLIMPPISLLTGGIDFSNWFITLSGEGPFNTLQQARDAGAITLNYGNFITVLIQFVIIAFAIFVVVKQINRLRALGEQKAEEKSPEAPAEERLLTEIRDILKGQRASA